MNSIVRASTLVLVLIVSACVTVDVKKSQNDALNSLAATESRPQSIDIYFKSYDPFDVATAAVSDVKEVTVRGTLRLPEGSGPFPAVVISNSSGGHLYDSVGQSLAKDLPKYGYATFAIQSLEARGQSVSLDNQQKTTLHSQAVDALYALEYLSTLPTIVDSKVCVTGHSRGAIAAFDFAYFQSFIDMSGFKGEPFACNIAINAGWHMVPNDKQTTGKPALVFIGEKDDIWHQDLNIAWIESLQKNNSNLDLVVLENTHHSLGTDAQFCPSAQTPKKCKRHTTYDKEGIYYKDRLVTRSENVELCVESGWHCRSANMNVYPTVLQKIVDFLNKSIGRN